MGRNIKWISLTGCLILWSIMSFSQTNTVQFGQNRLQFKNFKWRFYQSQNFNVYFSQNGLDLAKYVVQEAENELPSIENFMGFGLRKRLNIIVYNNYSELQQSNIGIGIDWQNTGGITKLVNNKMILYFDGDHNALRRQIREGIANVILQNLVFGDDVSDFAGNAVLLNLPQWFTDGFVSYVAENWSADLDNRLKQAIMSGRYESFNDLALQDPTLAGHAFWYYIENRYSKDKVSYLLYISRIDRSLKKACMQVLNRSFKQTLADIWTFNQQRYQQDNRGRRQYTRGTPVVSSEDNPDKDYYRFHPDPKNNNYAVVEFKKGLYKVLFYQGYYNPTVLFKNGVRQLRSQVNPDYPLLAWDPKGNRLAILYERRGSLELMVYDVITRTRTYEKLPELESVTSMQYMLDYNTLLFAATRNGHSNIYTYNLSTFKIDQITHDAYDDRDPSFVAFPRKSGIIYISNRPSATAPSSDTAIALHHYNVFLVDNWNSSTDKQISQLTDLQHSDARLPMQYSDTYFTFISDENGISNRYAGFFKSEANGLDSLFYIGGNIMHNPDQQDLDSALKEYGSPQADSVKVVAITKDSTYVFPLTNYSFGITESNISGDRQQVSDVIDQYGYKRVYKLKTDTTTLRRRNVTTRPTTFVRWALHQDTIANGLPSYYKAPDTTATQAPGFFQSPFGNASADSLHRKMLVSQLQEGEVGSSRVLGSSVLGTYHLKFSTDYLITQFDNSVLIDRYQPFTGGGGPIYLEQPLNGLIQVGVSDLMEDIKFTGGFQIPTNLDGSEYFLAFENFKHLVDWKLQYYRKVIDGVEQNSGYNEKLKTNLFEASAVYPLDPVRSFRATLGYRMDNFVTLAMDPVSLSAPDYLKTYGEFHLEYVYDNTINPATNIWNGTRYKVYGEIFPQLNTANRNGEFTFNTGFDAREYVKIYKNFIWATRVAGDFSFGTQKVIYYMGGVDNWLFPKFDNSTPVDFTQNYTFQTLSENLRGYDQNIKNGNNSLLLNTELRLPVFATFIDQPINSNFIRNFQITSFVDVGTAWSQALSSKDDSYTYYGAPGPVIVREKNGVLGPFAGGYGFGARTTLFGYFLRFDAAWPMTGFFHGSPILYLALGVDF
jgi:hypothetical protein